MVSNDSNKTVKSFTINMASLNNSVPPSDIEEDHTFGDDDLYSYPSPPLRTAFGAKFNQQVMFVENSRRDIPYPDAVPLSTSRRCDCIDVPDLLPSSPAKTFTYCVTSQDVRTYAVASLGAWILLLIDLGANGYVCG